MTRKGRKQLLIDVSAHTYAYMHVRSKINVKTPNSQSGQPVLHNKLEARLYQNPRAACTFHKHQLLKQLSEAMEQIPAQTLFLIVFYHSPNTVYQQIKKLSVPICKSLTL